MNVISFLFLIILGCFFLVFGANRLVDNSTLIAKCYKIPMLIIGMTVVAFGTSLPELVVNIVAALEGNSTIALTNIYGSNFLNILIILGLSSVIFPISSKMQSIKIDIPFAIITSCLMLLFNWTDNMIDRNECVMLLVFFSFFLCSQFLSLSDDFKNEKYEEVNKKGVLKYTLMIILGLIYLIIGGKIVVYGAENVAICLGVPESIIGLTIVALGTSLPELVTSCVAAYKKNADIALGNIIGSNMFNILCIIGVSGLIHPLHSYEGYVFDGIVMILATILVLVCILTNKEKKLKRWHGVLFLVLYGVYLTYKIMFL